MGLLPHHPGKQQQSAHARKALHIQNATHRSSFGPRWWLHAVALWSPCRGVSQRWPTGWERHCRFRLVLRKHAVEVRAGGVRIFHRKRAVEVRVATVTGIVGRAVCSLARLASISFNVGSSITSIISSVISSVIRCGCWRGVPVRCLYFARHGNRHFAALSGIVRAPNMPMMGVDAQKACHQGVGVTLQRTYYKKMRQLYIKFNSCTLCMHCFTHIAPHFRMHCHTLWQGPSGGYRVV